jgi:hypothetical protein
LKVPTFNSQKSNHFSATKLDDNKSTHISNREEKSLVGDHQQLFYHPKLRKNIFCNPHIEG